MAAAAPPADIMEGPQTFLIADLAREEHLSTVSMNLSDELKRCRGAAMRLYSGSLMSTAKWRAVFMALRSDLLGIRQIVAKFVNVEEARAMGLPWLSAPPRLR